MYQVFTFSSPFQKEVFCLTVSIMNIVFILFSTWWNKALYIILKIILSILVFLCLIFLLQCKEDYN